MAMRRVTPTATARSPRRSTTRSRASRCRSRPRPGARSPPGPVSETVDAVGKSRLQFHPELGLGVQDRLQAIAEPRAGERAAERGGVLEEVVAREDDEAADRKSTRLNSSH